MSILIEFGGVNVITISKSDLMKKAWKLARTQANKIIARLSYAKAKNIKASHFIAWALKESWKLFKGANKVVLNVV